MIVGGGITKVLLDNFLGKVKPRQMCVLRFQSNSQFYVENVVSGFMLGFKE